jgi:hypothetical protein
MREDLPKRVARESMSVSFIDVREGRDPIPPIGCYS